MWIEPIFLYAFIGSTFFLSLLVVVLVWVQISLIRTLAKMERKAQQWQLLWDKKERELVLKAKMEAQKIVKEAIRRAAKIEKAAKMNQEKFAQQLDERTEKVVVKHSQQLAKVSEATLQRYQQALNQNINKSINILKSISKDIEKGALKAMEAEVEDYRRERLKKVEEQIYEIISNLSQEVLGKSLSLREHEKLIFEALKKAKKQGGFR